MLRQLAKIIFLGILIVGGSVGLYFYEKNRSSEAKLQEQVKKLEEQRQHLQQFVSRLVSERRVAEIVVTEQIKSGQRIESTTLMFVEYGRDAKQLPPRFFTIKGNVAHIDSLVIKFERGFIENGDALRGHSLALFYRLYGDYQAPTDGFRIDEPGKSPEFYRPDLTLPPNVQAFEADLWQNFWRLADDEKFREEKGVRVAQGEGPWAYFYPERVYTLSLEADGGLSLTARPMEGIWRELLDAIRKPRAA